MSAILREAVREARDARDRAQEAFVRAVMDARKAGAGYGRIAQWLDQLVKCPDCDDGEVDGEPCLRCGGDGRILKPWPRSTVQSMVNRYEKRK